MDGCIERLRKRIPLEEFELICLTDKIREICIEEPNVVVCLSSSVPSSRCKRYYYSLLLLLSPFVVIFTDSSMIY